MKTNEMDADRRAGYLRHRRHRSGQAATGARRRYGRNRCGVKDCEKEDQPIDLMKIPNVTYCHPEIGSVGLTEAAAARRGYNVKVGKFPFTANSRASIVGEHEGFIKIVSDAKYGEILGVHIIGPQATELIAEAVAAMELEATVEDLMWTIHAHPTLAEAMLDASNSVYGLAINM